MISSEVNGPSARTLVRAARVLDGVNATPHEQAAVLVQDGRVVALVQREQDVAQLAAGAELVELGDVTLLPGPAIACQALLCPAVDASMSQPSIETFAQGYSLESEHVALAWARYHGQAPADEPLVSPLAAALDAPLPPTSIAVAECDPLRDDGIAYAAKLAAVGTDVRLHCWPGQLHGFHLCTAKLAIAPRAVDELARDVRELLGAPPSERERGDAAR